MLNRLKQAWTVLRGKIVHPEKIYVYRNCAAQPEEILMTFCALPPEGWTCSRGPGHDGPCAARPKEPIIRSVPFLGGHVVFCEKHTYAFYLPKKHPWYTRLWRKICGWLSPLLPTQIPQDVGYKFKYEYVNSKTGERTDVTPSFERTSDAPTNPA